jgi:MFS family permease
MAQTTVTPELRRARVGAFLTFVLAAALSAVWIVRVPAMVDKLHLRPSTVGIVVLCWGAGALFTMQLTRRLLVTVGTRRALLFSAPASTASIALIGLAPNYPLLLAAAVVFGMAFGVLDIAMNTQAAAIERAYGEHLMNGMHAGWSVGAVSGGVAGSIAAGLGFSFTATVVGAAIVATPLAFALGPTFMKDEDEEHDRVVVRGKLPPVVYLVGAITFAAFMVEGSVADWSGLYLTNNLRSSQAVAALAYPAFELGALGGRLLGDRWRTALGTRNLLTLAGLGSALALGAVLIVNNWVLGVIAFFAVGVAISTVVPIAFSLAGDIDPPRAAAAISTTGTMGYTGLLLGPVAIGLLADATSLRAALLIAVVLGIGIAIGGRVLPTQWRVRSHDRVSPRPKPTPRISPSH